MLDFLKWFSPEKKKLARQEQGWEIARSIGPLLDQKAMEIFRDYKEVLLSESVTYIIPAVWGVEKEGELSAVQSEIKRKLSSTLGQVFQILDDEQFDESHKYVLSFLVRNLMVSKILFAIECFKNHLILNLASDDDEALILDDVEHLGKLH